MQLGLTSSCFYSDLIWILKTLLHKHQIPVWTRPNGRPPCPNCNLSAIWGRMKWPHQWKVHGCILTLILTRSCFCYLNNSVVIINKNLFIYIVYSIFTFPLFKPIGLKACSLLTLFLIIPPYLLCLHCLLIKGNNLNTKYQHWIW